jgi:Raf kinase inhibitor-like YbhB/YbcL family protein
MTRQLDAGAALPEGAVAAKNGKGQAGYAGPCPPSGRHHYHFQVYALDTTLRPGMSRGGFLAAIKGHVMAQGELIGTYEHGQ